MAIFLALGLGILVGTTVLDDSLVNNLQARTEQLTTQLDDLRTQIVQVQGRVAQLNTYTEDVQPFVLSERLPGREVIVITADGVDGAPLDEAVNALGMSGARVVATLTAQLKLAAESPADQRALAELLGRPQSTAPEQLMQEAARALAARISVSPLRVAGTGTDPLGQYLTGGFLTASGIGDADLPNVGGPAQVVVVVGGGSEDSAAMADGFLVPFVAALTQADMKAAAGEGAGSTYPFVSAVRSASDSGALVTIDGLDQPVGGTALVLAVQRLLTTGEGGAYGLGRDAARLLPPPTG